MNSIEPNKKEKNWLLERFEKMKQLDPELSLRRFSHVVGLSPAHVSLIFKKERKLSQKAGERIAERLNLNLEDRQKLFFEIGGTNKIRPRSSKHLDDEEFRLISKWYYFAILCLAETSNNLADPEAIASTLSIPTAEAEMALERLVERKYLRLQEGRMFPDTGPLNAGDMAPSHIIRKHHAEMLERAQFSLEQDLMSMRYFSSNTFALDQEDIQAAKDCLMECEEKLDNLLKTKKPNKVYTLSIQFFPQSR